MGVHSFHTHLILTCKMQICPTFECSVGIMLLLKRSIKELTMLHGINVQEIIPFKLYMCLFCEVGILVRRIINTFCIEKNMLKWGKHNISYEKTLVNISLVYDHCTSFFILK